MNGSAQIKNIVRRNDGGVSVHVRVGNDSGHEDIEFVLLSALFEDMGLQMGDADEDVLDALDYASRVTAAYISACASFAYTQSSLKALYRKLIAKGFPKDVSLDATELMREQGLLDEESVAQRRAEIMLSKLWGRARIIQKLYEEGFSAHTLKCTLTLLDGTDFCENCVRLIEKKYPSLPRDRRDKERMYASISRMGYSHSEIRTAINMISKNE